MATLYSRYAELFAQELDSNRAVLKTFLFKGYRIQFDVTKTFEGVPNSGTLKIYNVDAATRETLDKVGNLVRLRAGYGDNINEVLVGSVLKSDTVREGTEIVTTLEIGDGAFALASAHVSQVFTQGTTEQTILQAAIDVIKEQGISVSEDYDKSVFSSSIPRAVTIAAPAKEVLNEYTQKNQMTWSIQDGQLRILKLATGSVEAAVLLTPKTGLIGSPRKSFDAISFQTLLIPELKIGRKVRIETSTVEGNFVVLRMNLRGDTFGGDWGIACEGLIL